MEHEVVGEGAARRGGRRRRVVALCAAVVVAVVALFSVSGPAGAVVGGEAAEPGQFPFAAGTEHISCSGSLIAPTWVLSAAHCARDDYTGFRIGSTSLLDGGEVIPIKRHVVHPDHAAVPGANFESNDLWLIELERPAAETPIDLIGPDQPSLDAPGADAAFAGYGEVCSPFDPDNPFCYERNGLRWTSFPIITPEVCASAEPSYASVDGNTMLCTLFPGGGHSPCFRDSGGPLFVERNGRKVQVGVVSGGAEPCGRPDGPAVYMRVSAYLGWISDVTGIDFDGPSTTTTSRPTTTSGPTTTSRPTTSTPRAPTPVAASPAFAG